MNHFIEGFDRWPSLAMFQVFPARFARQYHSQSQNLQPETETDRLNRLGVKPQTQTSTAQWHRGPPASTEACLRLGLCELQGLLGLGEGSFFV